ncbi:MAG: LysM peptidoglycan-binding domain-containing protein [Phycisphaerales bacterium]|jgi:nucleoid-associated protein YgaU|nr:LysM peptidoglycan-binding domain-containing protein [Phycisphaerales bacterium]
MTRETKIGLLVGLAFIIVIGILLSDHVTNSTEPPGAQLAGAGPNVRSSVDVPASGNPPVTTVPPVTPPPVTPEQPVPTQRELAPRPQVVQVEVGPGSNGNNNPAPVQTTNPPAPTTPADPVVTQTPPSSPNGPLDQVAREHNEQIVPANPDGSSTPAATATASNSGNMRAYKAEPGDTLSKMAGRFMGANTKANREAIIRANPSLQADPNLVVVGRTYMIPTSPTQNAQATPPASPTQTVSTTTPRSGETTYTAKEGDSLWRIAEEQLGDGRLYTMIKDLNKEVLKGGETVKPGMVLRMPPRQVASAE